MKGFKIWSPILLAAVLLAVVPAVRAQAACRGGGIVSGYGAGSAASVRQSAYGPGDPALKELRGVWISYLEWSQLPKDEAGFKNAVNTMFDNCASWGLNAVFIHVHSHGDAIYPSSYYPWSKFASGQQGQAPGYDPLAYMVEAAHEKGLEFHAWFNPYRVTGYLMDWSEVSEESPAKKWLHDDDPSNDRYVLKHDGEYYYNPSVPAVRELVVNSVAEVVDRYPVDGIHFDDYFYPELRDDQESRWFDRPEYLSSGQSMPIAQWRREQVSSLVRDVYQAVKRSDPGVLFGISPQGYVDHLRSDQKLFVDIDRWMQEDGFIDYIMPQLYWGFETKTPSLQPAPYAFEQNLNTWIQLKHTGQVKLYLGLGLYRAHTDVKDYNPVSEWLCYDDIISRQVMRGRESGEVAGYSFFSYSSFLDAQASREVANLLPVLRGGV